MVTQGRREDSHYFSEEAEIKEVTFKAKQRKGLYWSLFHFWDKTHDTCNLEERFTLATVSEVSVRGWLDPRQEHHGGRASQETERKGKNQRKNDQDQIQSPRS